MKKGDLAEPNSASEEVIHGLSCTVGGAFHPLDGGLYVLDFGQFEMHRNGDSVDQR